jgi:DNA-binding transcriptional MocR family regulator
MAGQLDLSQIGIDRAAPIPLAEQVRDAIEREISGGSLPTKLSPSDDRELAAALGVNRGTVQAAYRLLAERGLVEGRVGSGTVVLSGPDSPAPLFGWTTCSRGASRRFRGVFDSLPASLFADFSRLAPDERFFPLEEFTRTVSYTWSRRRDLWSYAPPLGLEELRVEISRRLSEHGIKRSPSEILVVSGAQQGLDLLFRTFTDPGDAAAMESPTYSGALALARLAGVTIVPMPMDEGGPDSRRCAGGAPSSST